MTLFVIAKNAKAAERHAAAAPSVWPSDKQKAISEYVGIRDAELRREFHLYAVEDGPGECGKLATLIDRIGEAVSCLMLIIGGMWAAGAFSLWERLA